MTHKCYYGDNYRTSNLKTQFIATLEQQNQPSNNDFKPDQTEVVLAAGPCVITTEGTGTLKFGSINLDPMFSLLLQLPSTERLIL
jgi:hypothetical protein